MAIIKQLAGREILDSRGRPTVEATCILASGAHASASVPSGTSTGTAEALELRDGDESRYHGLGCQKAVYQINSAIRSALVGKDFMTQHSLDTALITLDGTPNKRWLGANAILAVSLAFARAVAAERNLPLYVQFAEIFNQQVRTLPRMTINLFSGGKHAGGQVSIQDVLVVPLSARTIDEGLAMTYAVYQAAAELIDRRYGMRTLTADEGGLAPPFPSTEAMIEDAVAAIEAAGLQPGWDVALAIDVASSHFYRDGHYHLGPEVLDSNALIDRLCTWLDRYPIISIEDGLAEEDWEHWPQLRARLAGQALVLGDDLLCTNPARIQRAIEARAANALLLKVNQIGTLTEAAEACRLACSANWCITVSVRSGETEDTWLADLAVGWGGNQIKAGGSCPVSVRRFLRRPAHSTDQGW
jgi:enolase